MEQNWPADTMAPSIDIIWHSLSKNITAIFEEHDVPLKENTCSKNDYSHESHSSASKEGQAILQG